MLQKALNANLREHADDHPPSHSVFGFWLYLMTDCVIFAALFAAFAALGHQYAGGPTARDLFDIPGVAAETAALLLSSITYGGVSRDGTARVFASDRGRRRAPA
jgi:cytochrome o ubiquinol oxidase subunit III